MRYLIAVVASAALLSAARADLLVGPPARQAQAVAAGQSAARERAYRANNVGVAHLEQFDYKGAEQSFREALKLQPDLAMARLNLAIALFYDGRTADAAAAARDAATRLPDLPQTHYVVGLIAKAENRLEDAEPAFGRVLKIDPSDAATKVQLGQIHLQQRSYPAAIRLFQEALAAEPFNVTAAYSAAMALTRSGQTDEGRSAMQRFEKLRDSVYGVTYSQTYLGQGRYAEAVASTGAEPELVNTATPAVTFAEVQAVPDAVGGSPGKSGGLTLFDADGDGDLDLVDTGRAGTRLFHNARAQFTNVSARAGLDGLRDGVGVIAGDYDNDTRSDLLVLRAEGLTLLHQKADGAFEDVTPAAALPSTIASTVAFADVDHDGDLDIFAAGKGVRLLRNNGNGTFADMTENAALAAPIDSAFAIAPADFDNRRDLDLLVGSSGHGPVLYRNMRDGSFRNAAAEVDLPQTGRYTALAVADVNKDGFPDIFLAGGDAAGTFALSDGHGRFRASAAPDVARGAVAAQFADYDNDGLLDLIVLTGGVRILRNLGGAKWSDVTDAARLPGAVTRDGAVVPQSMALGDLDGDGDTDIVVRENTGRVRVFRNEGGNKLGSLRARLAGRVSNRSGFGARIEMRAGSLRQALELSSSSPAIAPADLVFGLGARPAADVVRVLWPSGILQAEIAPATKGGAPFSITELDRKPSSCPYLFTWNGTRFEFVTDFMGGGEMGGWQGPATWSQPDPDEYVRITDTQLQPRGGRYEIRMTNELEEALFFDRVQLIAVDHDNRVSVYPNEGLKSPPRQPFTLTAVRDARPPVRAIDEHGDDVLSTIASIDRRYPDDFRTLPIRGYAEPHELILDTGPGSDGAVLLMTGWTDYAFSNDNVAASHGGITMSPPALQVKDAQGVWRTVVEEIGFPVGRPQTVVVDLGGKFLSASREVRIVTNMRIYWDQILVASRAEGGSSPRLTRLDGRTAQLRWRGVSHETTPDGREPFGYDYERVSMTVPWKVLVGRYTREGDVRTLLGRVDDLFVISRPGDEIAVSFDALPDPAPGWSRTFLLYVHGYSKEMNPRSASPDTVAPLPFRAMSRYPYADGEHYPHSRVHREYQDRYNTRVVTRAVPSIDGGAVR